MQKELLFKNNGDIIGKKPALLQEFKTYLLQNLEKNEFENAKDVLETIIDIDNRADDLVLIVTDYPMGVVVNVADSDEVWEFEQFLLGKGEI